MNIFKNKRVIVTLSWVLVVFWMSVIFNMSSQVREDSNNLSKGITHAIVKAVEKAFPDAEINVDKFNHILRKNAHFFTYLLLGVLVSRVLNVSGMKGINLFVISLILCVVYAISDEAHQHFVPGRGPQIRDVFIDSLGSTVGIFIYIVLSKFRKSKFT